MTRPPDDLPPSAKLVYTVLARANDPLPWTRLQEQTALADSTLSDALETLDAADHLAVEPNPDHAGGQVYTIHSEYRSKAETDAPNDGESPGPDAAVPQSKFLRAVNQLYDGEPVSSIQIAERVGVPESTARYHLDKLHDQGEVDIHVEFPGSSGGRPSEKFLPVDV